MSILVASWTLKSLVGCIIWGASSGAGSVITSFWKERICSLAFSASLARDKRSAAFGARRKAPFYGAQTDFGSA